MLGKLAAKSFWRMPSRFGVAQLLGSSYGLRSVVFHDVAAEESPFTRGMGVSTTPLEFEASLKFLTRYYTPVCLQDVLAAFAGQELPPRAVLVTCDDGYASSIERVAPLCRRYGVPAVFFLNAAFLDNRRLSPDNLVCFVANTLGMETINAAVRTVRGSDAPKLKSMAAVFSNFFPAISLAEREVFLNTLTDLGRINERRVAEEAALYLTREQVGRLAAMEFEIGNHTYSHVRCRTLAPEDLGGEIARNKTELETASGKIVRSFSVPYGSSQDLTGSMAQYLERSGYSAAFLSESAANLRGVGSLKLDRVSPQAYGDHDLFFQVEVLPRIRSTRNRIFRNPGSPRAGYRAD